MKVDFTGSARADLLAIGDYISLDNPLRALSFIDELEERCIALESLPYAYPVLARRPAFQYPPARAWKLQHLLFGHS